MNALLEKFRSRGLLDSASVERVRASLAEGKPLDQALALSSGLPPLAVLRLLGDEFHLAVIDLDQQPLDRALLARFPARVLLEYNLLPIDERNGTVRVATHRPFQAAGLDVLRLMGGRDVEPVLAPGPDIERCLKQTLGVGADTVQSLVSDAGAIEVVNKDEDGEADLAEAAQDASIVRFVNQVLSEAIDLKATDVHFEPFEDRFRVRYRVDGVLLEASIPAEVRRFQAAIVSRLKILSHLDIAEKRLPQDGRIKLKVAAREVDVRVSVIPMLHGEAVVLRLLDRAAPLLGLERLGMAERDRTHFARVLDLPHGIVLVTGPTGSGKTTTLYAALSQINDVERKIITIEDPIEYHLAGINQIQVSAKAGLTFARGLRSILRHDPDVILIGEIRDRETAEIAVQASLTGHLVFSTLHTNDSASAVTRLVDMGIEPYLLASSLEIVVAQRLVRLVCPGCRQSLPPSDVQRRELLEEFGSAAPKVVHSGAGCRQCRGTGYSGRSGIFEIMPVSDEIRSLTMTRAPAAELARAALRQGMGNLRDDGRRLVLEGRTTLEEVLRVTKGELNLNGHNGRGTAQVELAEEPEQLDAAANPTSMARPAHLAPLERARSPRMPTFVYNALDTQGRTAQGTLLADSRAEALAQITQRGLSPVTLEAGAEPAANAARVKPLLAGRRVRPAEVEAFTRELANLLAAGVPLGRALHVLRREASQPAARAQWTAIYDEVVGGAPLAEALARWPQSFPPVYVAMVRAGETGGFLDVVLMQIADFRARETELKGKVKTAMVYPAVLAIVALGVMVFMLTFFIPRFAGIFREFGGSLPMLTRGIIAASSLVTVYGLAVLVALVVAVVLVRRAARSEGGRRFFERWLLRVPAVGTVVARFALVRFARMLGTLLGAGVPLITALRVAREAIGNQTLSDAVSIAVEEVKRGVALSRSLAACPQLFPASVAEMIAVAEESGRLDKELLRLATTYEGDLDRRLRMLVALAEPALLFVMAALIGTIVVGMLLPIFTLQELIK